MQGAILSPLHHPLYLSLQLIQLAGLVQINCCPDSNEQNDDEADKPILSLRLLHIHRSGLSIQAESVQSGFLARACLVCGLRAL